MNELMDLLAKGEVRVIFRKKENNIIRNLLCTLNPKYIPPEDMRTFTSVLGGGGPLVVVWDLEALDWRSFYLSSVISFDQVDD